MNLREVEKIVENSHNNNKWAIKGDQLCYRDGSTIIEFDRIDNETNWIGFRKLRLVCNGKLMNIGFFSKRSLHPKVLKKLNDIKVLINTNVMASSPAAPITITPVYSMGGEIKSTLRPDPIEDRTRAILEERINILSQSMHDVNRSMNPNISDEDELDKKIVILSDAELRNKKFKENVAKEKIRIRKLLRKDKD